MKRNLVELLIDEKQEDVNGVYAMSLVTKPAMESMFVAFSEQVEVKLAEVDSEKRIVLGAALIPNKKIYRKMEDKEFDVFLSEETIEKAVHLFFKNGHQNDSTIQHQQKAEGQTIVESWIVQDPEKDKQSLYGFNYPKGTWMVAMKVEDDDVWQQIKSGSLKGFSIEGNFTDKWYNMQEEEKYKNIYESIIKILEK
jgi:hypothetical protein